jgi:hypothetical protein
MSCRFRLKVTLSPLNGATYVQGGLGGTQLKVNRIRAVVCYIHPNQVNSQFQQEILGTASVHVVAGSASFCARTLASADNHHD